jgi:glycosyltransferase involved in cell wall biosynthesis
MSVFNAEDYLDEAITSILKQSYSTFEFIIINDGSTDNSLHIIDKYMAYDSRIVLINQVNKGLPAALNAGISVAKGKYVARMDADDISLPQRLEFQVTFMEQNPEVGVCGTWAEVFGKTAGTIKHPEKHDELKAKLLFNVCFAHPTVMIKLKFLLDHNIKYDTNFRNSQDYKLWSDLVDITKFANIPKILLRYRTVDSSITSITDSTKTELRFSLLNSIFIKFFDEIQLTDRKRNNKMHFNLGLKERINENKYSYKEINLYFNSIIKANNTVGYFNEKCLKKELSFRFISVFYFNLRKGNGFSFEALLYSFFYFNLLSIVKRKLLEK